MSVFDYYLIGINVIGLILLIINHWLYSHTATGQIDTVLNIISLMGGSLGILMGILIFERKPIKNNMMSRVFIACVFVIQVIIFLVMKGLIAQKMTLAFWTFFASNKLFVYYLLVINVITFIAFAIDKINAVKNKFRIKIITLLGLAFIGGSLGALAGMYLLRHKTKKDYFTVGVPLIMVMQAVVIFYLMNMK